jgi:hypothetical protein
MRKQARQFFIPSLNFRWFGSVVFRETWPFMPLESNNCLYNVGMGVEDPICDQHSANSSDEVVKIFWGQTNLNRVFPELYNSGARPREQAHRYNYSICGQVQASESLNTNSSPVQRFIDSISSIRAQLSESLPKEARSKVKTLRADLTEYWHGRLPDLVQNDLDSIDKAIDRAIESKNSVTVDSQSVLALTMYLLLPGRTDCHAAQVNINGVVQ